MSDLTNYLLAQRLISSLGESLEKEARAKTNDRRRQKKKQRRLARQARKSSGYSEYRANRTKREAAAFEGAAEAIRKAKANPVIPMEGRGSMPDPLPRKPKMSGGKKALLAALGTGAVGAATYGAARGVKARKAAKANAMAKAKLKKQLKMGGGAAAATGGLAGLAALGLSD